MIEDVESPVGKIAIDPALRCFVQAQNGQYGKSNCQAFHCLIMHLDIWPKFEFISNEFKYACKSDFSSLNKQFNFRQTKVEWNIGAWRMTYVFKKTLTLSVPEPVTVKNRPSSATKPACALMSGKPLSPWSPCNQWMPLLGYKNSTYVSWSPHMIAACSCVIRCVLHVSCEFFRKLILVLPNKIYIVND